MSSRESRYRVAVIAAAIMILSAGMHDCIAGSRIFKGKITGRNGEAVPDAVVYIEVYREGRGTFDFGYAVTDTASAGTFSLNLSWRRNARTAYAVFAPGMKTIAGFDRTRYYETNDLQFVLDSIAPGGQDCATRLVGMGFPFENQPSLAGRLKHTAYLPLVRVFIDAYAPIINETCPVPSGYEEKTSAVKGLLPAVAP